VLLLRYYQSNKAAILADHFNQQEINMRFLHTMVRVSDIDASLDFDCNKLGMVEVRRKEVEAGRFTLIFLAAPKDEAHAKQNNSPELELTYNWDPEDYDSGRNFGHLAYRVDNIYETCQKLMDAGITINRPPRDGYMAFVKSPDNISIEILQEGDALPPQAPWKDMENTGTW
jgi:lactoylglutathione lyase